MRERRWYARSVALVDVVVVSFNSAASLRRCVEPLALGGDLNVIVADNASRDGSLDSVTDLSVRLLALPRNGGFAYGCNAGWRAGEAPFVLFLNPDATIDEGSVRRLAAVLQEDESVGITAPRILEADGSLDFSQRRFPRLRSTYAEALFLHRLLPRSVWTSEMVRREGAYAQATSPEWVSGACLLVRRSLLEELEGFDEGFFLYCEDKDLCRRVRDKGYDVRFVPEAVAVHEGGASAPRAGLLQVLAASRIRYACKHRSRAAAELERAGVALNALTHVAVSRGGRAARAGHVAALRAALAPRTSVRAEVAGTPTPAS
jgi:N-acetylglucosaminyl-diphospho-decaprenol L-rhamnosyltransferase